MSTYTDQVRLHARIQLQRHLRSPAIWVLAIVGPVAARFLVPEPGASYNVLGVNDAVLKLSASVIGLQLGVLIAVMLAPLAYIFLKAGPTRIRPWQVTDVTPGSRSALSLGSWLGDVAALWLLMLTLALAGVVVSLFRLPLAEVSPFQTILSLCLIAGPALAVIAAIRTCFSMRPILRRAGGDVMFFVLWLAGLTVSAMFFMSGEGGAPPLVDMFGFAAPIAGGTDEVITELYIGGPPTTNRVMEFDAMAGVTQPGFLLSRLAWLCVAGFIAWAAGFTYKAGRFKPNKAARNQTNGEPVFSGRRVDSVKPWATAPLTQLVASLRELIQPLWVAGLIGVIAIGGLFLPLRGVIGPAVALILIFPLTAYGARWRNPSIAAFLSTLPMSSGVWLLQRLVIACGLSLLLLIPSMISLPGEQWADVVAIGLGLPVIAVLLGHITRGPVAARLLLLILWYGYLNLG